MLAPMRTHLRDELAGGEHGQMVVVVAGVR